MPKIKQILARIAAGDLRAILMVSLALYLLVLPAMLLAARSYQPVAEPRGAKVEQVFPVHNSRWTTAQTHIFNTPEEWSRVVVFEGTEQLRPDRYEAKPFGSNGWVNIIIRGSDNTDPATNGRRYYVIVP
jgi:hypothetical protein